MKTPRLAERIAQQLESLIANGDLVPGERLPPERRLAESLGVSRPSLREAIRILASKGLLQTRPGGGTYVAATIEVDLVEPLIALLRDQPETRYDVLEVRRALEGSAAYYAARRAVDGALPVRRNSPPQPRTAFASPRWRRASSRSWWVLWTQASPQ